MFTPTKKSLEELGFKIIDFWHWFLATYETESWIADIEYNSLDEKWTKYVEDKIYLQVFYPDSIEDIQTLIRLLSPH